MNEKRSWLEGPELPGVNEDPTKPSSYPGEAMGLPQEGPGSLSPLMPRMLALVLDWLLCWGMAWFLNTFTHALGGISTATLLLFAILRIISVWLFSQSPGHSVVGIGVARVDAVARVGLWRAVVRTLLTIFMLPPVVQDTDGRGLHDRVTQTAVIRTR